MPQQQQFESEKRYDEETVQKILAAAGRLQQEHRETLSAEQVEAIGQEVGLEPVFIRQVLAQMEQQQQQEQTVPPQATVAPESATTTSEERSTAFRVLAIAAVVAVAFLVTRMAAAGTSIDPSLRAWLIFCAVFAVVLLRRRRRRHRRR